MKADLDGRDANVLEVSMQNMRSEMSANGMIVQRAEVVLMFLWSELLQQVDWVNQRLRMKNISHHQIMEGDIVGFIAVLWWSN